MSGALVYLTLASVRNRIASAVQRLRSPRYAAALVLGAVYLWFVLLRPSRDRHDIALVLLGARTELLITFAVLVYVVFGWFSSGDRRSLAFSEAEVHFLFPAPLTRRSLVGYKVFRSQLLIAFNALIWVFVLRRGGGEELPPVLRYLSVWIVLSNVALQRLGAALVRVSWQEHGRAGLRRQAVPAAVFLGVLAALVVVIGRAAPALRAADGPGAILDVLAAAVSTPLATAVLFPFRIAVAPVFTHAAGTWARAMGPALGLALLQVWWVLRTDAAFEEAAVQASVDRARRIETLRGRGRGGARRVTGRAGKRTLRLAPSGPPAYAIVWKNALCLMRTGQLTALGGIIVMAGAVAAVSTSASGARAFEGVATFAFVLVGLLFVMGTRLLRVDLRQDMLHLDALKALPLGGGAIVAAEVASSVVPIAAAQVLLVLTGYAALEMMPDAPLDAGVRLALVLCSPAILLALDSALLAIHNATALLFPSWARLGTQRPSGVEMLGQGILTTFGSMLVLGIGLVPPAAVCLAVLFGFGRGPVSIAVAAIAGSALLLGEVWWAVGRLGRAFERSEPGLVA